MIHRIVGHLRGQWLGAIALFIALGSTSYAAVSIPRNSVGSKQLRNGAVTPKKLNHKSFGGHILMTAVVDDLGHVISSTPRGASTIHWTNHGGHAGWIKWHRSIPKNCFALASLLAPQDLGPEGSGPPTTETVPGGRRQAAVVVTSPVATSYQVAVICP